MNNRILWLTENYPPRRGGMAQACDRIVSCLRHNGVIVDVAFFNATAGGFKVTSQMNGKLIAIPVSDSPAHSLNLLYNYISDPVNKLNYTHVAAFGGTAPMLALPIYKSWLNLEAVTLLRGNDFDVGVFQPARRQILFDALNASDTVCVLHSEAKHRVSSLLPEANVVCIPNGIDTVEWQNDPFDFETAINFRHENGIADDQIVVGLFGQLKEKKGVVFLLENLLRTGLQEKITILTVGDIEPAVQAWIDEQNGVSIKTGDEGLTCDGSKEQQIAEQTVEAAEIGNTSNVFEKPHINIVQLPFKDRFELLSLYPACDFIALPSHYDGMPNVLLEAGALGIPVIGARTGGIFEVLPEEQHCLTFHPGNADQCRQALNKAAELTADGRKIIGSALKKNIEANFNLAKEAESYKKIFGL